MKKKTIVILADSRKHGGRCIAGREIAKGAYGNWIRPVSDRVSEEISDDERTLDKGGFPQVLDVVEIPVEYAEPHSCQTENWRIDSKARWSKVGAIDWAQAYGLTENPSTLWENGRHTYAGLNDEMLAEEAKSLKNSLYMIHVEKLVIRVGKDFNGNKAIRAYFQHRNDSYRLKVTDTKIASTYLAKDEGDYALGESLLTISIGEPFLKNDGIYYQYKLVAAVIPR